MKPRDKVWLEAGGRHFGIVIRVSEDGTFALILQATGTAGRDVPCEPVDQNTRLGKALRLTKKTYFYQTNLCVRHVDDVEPNMPPVFCPIAIWEKLEPLALAGVRADPRLAAVWLPAAPVQAPTADGDVQVPPANQALYASKLPGEPPPQRAEVAAVPRAPTPSE